MANCKFLRQKKQIKINGEWVDTMSYRYLPYCDGGTSYVIIKGGKSNETIFIDTEKYGDGNKTRHKVTLDADGNGYLELEDDDCVKFVSSKCYKLSINGCYVGPFTCLGVKEVVVSCSRYNGDIDISGYYPPLRFITSITFKGFDTSNATTMSQMFFECHVKTLDVSSFNTSKVTDMYGMFGGCINLTHLNASSFDTSNVTDMNGMFAYCYELTSLDVSSFDTSKVTDMGNMFERCYELTSLDVSSFNTSNVTNMYSMFEDCRKLESIDVSSWDTSNVTDMSDMFAYCYELTSLDVSNFDTSNVTNMSHMFCGSNVKSLDVSSWDTSNVTDMSDMFEYCDKLTSLDVSSFDTSKVTDMYGMFAYCKNLSSIDVSSFDTSNVKDVSGMFRNCDRLETLNLSGWDFSKATINNPIYMEGIFIGDHSLKTIYMRGCSQITIGLIKSELKDEYILDQVTIIT